MDQQNREGLFQFRNMPVERQLKREGFLRFLSRNEYICLKLEFWVTHTEMGWYWKVLPEKNTTRK